MYIDAITLAAVADEWRKLLIGARVDTIIQPTEHAIAFQCYAPAMRGEDEQRNLGEQVEHGGHGGQNRWLYLSAHPQLARAHLTALKPPKIVSEPPPFVMLLRKYLEGARIEAIEQPRWERVLEVTAGHRLSPDSDERVHYRLIVEIMGRLSNIIFCDDHGLILGSLKRVGADVNRYRTIAANIQYVPPPPQRRTVGGLLVPKLEPTTITAARLLLCVAEDQETAAQPPVPTAPTAQTVSKKPEKARKSAPEQTRLWQLLTRHLLGFSPLLAREAVYRAMGDAEMPLSVNNDEGVSEDGWGELAWNIRELSTLYDTHTWHPQLVERVEAGADPQASTRPAVPIAVTPYVLEQYAQLPEMRLRQSPSINVLLDDYFARTEWQDAMESVRSPMRKLLQTQRDRCKRKVDMLQQELAALAESTKYRLHAELLLAHQNEVQQGQSRVVLDNYFAEVSGEGGEGGGSLPQVTVTLDPRFDAVGNANRLFNKYHKLRRAAALIPDQIEQNATELATIEQLLADLMLAETPTEVVLVKAEVQTAGYMRGAPKYLEKREKKAAKKGKGGKSGKGKPVPPGGGVPLHVQSRDGFTLLIGKNSRQNEEVTFHQATANDIWLHARGVPGAHVIIKAAGRDIPHTTIEQAASLAAYYSQARGTTTAPVDYTFQKHVRHMKGGGPGMVIYEREKTVYVAPGV
jgi:predicted ribosome quality control (RQC) complex YloA/Tae2 family protein